MALTARSRSFTNLVPLFGNISVSTLLLSGSPHSHSTPHSLVSFSFLRLYSYFQLTRSLHSPSPPSLLFTLSLRAANSSNATINPVPALASTSTTWFTRIGSPYRHFSITRSPLKERVVPHRIISFLDSRVISLSLSNTLHCPICFRSRIPSLSSPIQFSPPSSFPPIHTAQRLVFNHYHPLPF